MDTIYLVLICFGLTFLMSFIVEVLIPSLIDAIEFGDISLMSFNGLYEYYYRCKISKAIRKKNTVYLYKIINKVKKTINFDNIKKEDLYKILEEEIPSKKEIHLRALLSVLPSNVQYVDDSIVTFVDNSNQKIHSNWNYYCKLLYATIFKDVIGKINFYDDYQIKNYYYAMNRLIFLVLHSGYKQTDTVKKLAKTLFSIKWEKDNWEKIYDQYFASSATCEQNMFVNRTVF